MSSELRKDLINGCRQYLGQRKNMVQKALTGLKEDLENESKSSAGDKYETGREMINIEWNKLNVQLKEYERLDNILSRLPEEMKSDSIAVGSIIFTNTANYFISIPAGELIAGSDKFYAIGVQAPITRKLLGLKEGDEFEMNGRKIKILSIN